MKLSTINNLRILTHYYALILDYEDIFPASKRFRLIVVMPDARILICDTFFVSPESAREYFYKYFGKRVLAAESPILKEISPNDMEWFQFTSFQDYFFKEIEAPELLQNWKAEDSRKSNTYSAKGVN